MPPAIATSWRRRPSGQAVLKSPSFGDAPARRRFCTSCTTGGLGVSSCRQIPCASQASARISVTCLWRTASRSLPRRA